jgi:LPXTG-site transpeptidase (sortase) family protein
MNKLHLIKSHLSTPEFLKILILRTVGNFLVLSSLFMIGKTFYQPVKEEVRYFVEKEANKKYIVATTKQPVQLPSAPKGSLARILNIKPVEILQPVNPDFSIIIPKIGANAQVIPGVDVNNENIYLGALKKGVAQALGTAFPGQGKHIYLFAHSTDYIWNVGTYNAVFYLLYKLERGDEVDLFYQGHRYLYKVIGKQTVDPSQVEYLTRQTNKEFLTLQTCWPPGTTLQRLLVFATRVAE